MKILKRMYDAMEERFGDLGWWPAETPFEVAVGAVLTQNTSWKNVEKAISELKKLKLLTPEGVNSARGNVLAKAIRSSGYHNQKAKKLKCFCGFLLNEYDGSLRTLKKKDARVIRRELLSLNGIGPETADAILVYALDKPVFVVDAYTKRIFSRHHLLSQDADYDRVQALVHGNFRKDLKGLNQFHALLVETGKRYCKKKAGECAECPLFGI